METLEIWEICNECPFRKEIDECKECLFNLFKEMDKLPPFTWEEKKKSDKKQ